ncbi:hypothetical protein [Paraburkholderia domus]|jgi:hypothetical protein|uniref:Uncharacterized protein n=1 Tax=Paraburkholderia domus TaxID=2793075 RepID=A0A9N8NGK6_9BURK|nr:hypothetical protein [Paraburkholderia domus]MBK5054657.1 hypothetical protein [Burkholderia sp. R-70006]MBK5066459.1 hypothetical protein [Burkholderia sp. R-70199]MBK5125882.1 hypothetical protein [Burkholderia sp. R-69980]MBK5170108.1 hypothetical protein [Burkholderia sp. R-70211]CAE6864358.1 hypothetical protein R70006_08257 [Paraburkholderia domus]
MLTLTPEQFAILSLPDPHAFAPQLAAEIRRDYPTFVVNMDDTALTREVERSYRHASETLRITHLPTLVEWTQADVAWARGLRGEMNVDLSIRKSRSRNLTAQDLLSGMKAGAAWHKEDH